MRHRPRPQARVYGDSAVEVRADGSQSSDGAGYAGPCLRDACTAASGSTVARCVGSVAHAIAEHPGAEAERQRWQNDAGHAASASGGARGV